MKSMARAIDWLLTDEITTVRVWAAADRNNLSTKELVTELLARNILDASAAAFIEKLSGKEYETRFGRDERT